MIELGSAPAAPGPNGEPAAGDLVKDATDASFLADVIEASKETPVIVDFWAPWCGPCKQLTPALEKAVTAARGAVRLVKVNIDENQELAAQLRIQSVPTVYGFLKFLELTGHAPELVDFDRLEEQERARQAAQ